MYTIDDFRLALQHDQLFLEYIPTMSLEHGACVGAEALVRWQREGEVVYPLDFVPMLESTAFSGVLTYWVLDHVAAEMLDFLKEHPGIRISVNVPPEVFGRGGIYYVMRKSGLDQVPKQVMLEITERGVLDEVGLTGIQYAGEGMVQIALDDVNVHDAGLLVLSRVKANVIKLDNDFSDSILKPDWDPSKLDSIRAIIGSSDLKVIAEGVTDDAQVRVLREAGIQMAQGWLFSRALPAQRFMQFCDSHPLH